MRTFADEPYLRRNVIDEAESLEYIVLRTSEPHGLFMEDEAENSYTEVKIPLACRSPRSLSHLLGCASHHFIARRGVHVRPRQMAFFPAVWQFGKSCSSCPCQA